MRSRSGFLALVLLGCGARPAPAAESGAPLFAPGTISLKKAPDSGQVDRIGVADGALKPDGIKDLAFAIETDGPVVSFFLVAVDDTGKSTGAYQADTLVGDAEVPKAVAIKWGSGTAGLGVADGDRLLNAPDGAVPALGDGHHRLTLYVSPASVIKAGVRLRVFAQRPDHTVVAGETLTWD